MTEHKNLAIKKILNTIFYQTHRSKDLKFTGVITIVLISQTQKRISKQFFENLQSL